MVRDARSSDARARVRSVVAVGQRLSDPLDPLGREARSRLPDVTGLSPAGVELALRHHLERSIEEQELSAFLGRANVASRCHVVLSANVCTAALRAVAFGFATAPDVFVRPSRRDPVLAELIVRALAEDEGFVAAGGSITLVREIFPEGGDEVHAYGRDETLADLRAALPPDVTLRAHGTGLGIATVDDGADLSQLGEAIAAAVVPFDQRGCLSPRALFVEGDDARASRVSELVRDGLTAASARVPRGDLDAGIREELVRYTATVSALGAVFEGSWGAVGVDIEPRGLVLPPPARVVHIVPASVETALRLIAPWRDKITAVGVAEGAAVKRLSASLRSALPSGARFGPLGEMQRPPLDGPVDLR